MAGENKKVVTQEQIKQAGVILKREHDARLKAEGELAKLSSEKNSRERAEKIAFREVEMGISEPFKTHEEFQNKVASLMQDNLDVVEKALDRGYRSGNSNGELDDNDSKKDLDPFSRWVLHGETVNS